MALLSVFHVVKKVMDENPVLSKAMAYAELQVYWSQIVGKGIASNCHWRGVDEKQILRLMVPHPIWAQEIRNQKQQLLIQINSFEPLTRRGLRIKDIYVLLGRS
jgi:hypothetical protein